MWRRWRVGILCGFWRCGVIGADLTPETMPRVAPRAPVEALRTFEVRPGFRAELVAAEPLVQSPVAMTVDEAGVAYVVEMRDYSERRPEQLGRVRRLVDRDGDGRYDEATVFLDQLPWPTAITCWAGGVLVGATPEILFARDTDGDGVADVREVLFTGFASGYAPYATNQLNVQALLNSLQWGPDQRIHGSASASGGAVQRVDSAFTRSWRTQAGATNSGNPTVNLSGRNFSFDPRTLDFRAETGGGQHGMSFDDAGRKFVCSNSDHLQWVVFDEATLPVNPFHEMPSPVRSIAADGAAAPVFRRSPDEPWRVLRTRWRVAGVTPGMIEGGGRPSGYFTGATGVTLYRGDAYGPGFLGDAFVADCGSNLIHRKKIRRDAGRDGLLGERAADETDREFLASTDNWFRPVQFYNAPDGCLWVIDMYRETIEHPWSIPPALKRNLELDSGRERGRLWRLAPQPSGGAVVMGVRTVDRKAPTGELVRLLTHPNGWHRDTAARLLVERGDAAAGPALRALVGESPATPHRATALSVLRALGLGDPALWVTAAVDRDPTVRRLAVRWMTEALRPGAPLPPAWPAVLRRLADGDLDPEVQFETALALGSTALSPADRRAGLRGLLRSESPLIVAAAVHAAGDLESDLWRDVVRTEPAASAGLELIRVLGRRARADELTPVLVAVEQLPPALAWRHLAELTEGLSQRGRRIEEFARPEFLNRTFTEALMAAASDPATRPVALRWLGWDLRPGTARQLLERSARGSEAEATMTLAALRPWAEWLGDAGLLRHTWEQTPAGRRGALTELWLRRPEGARTLLKLAAETNRVVDPSTWTSGQVNALRNHSEAGIRTAARGLLGDPPANREAVVAEYASALSLAGEAAAGGRVFQERCATCHAFRGTGVVLGPDLASVAANGAEKLLVSILDPNRDVAPNFRAWNVETREGETLTGLVVRESADSVTLRQAGGMETTWSRPQLQRLETTGRSLMPEGLEQGWTPATLADLLAYLTRR